MRLLAAIILFFGAVSSAFANMSEDELRSELIGKNLSWKNGDRSGTASYASNGSAKLTMGGDFSDTGSWTIKSNEICVTWKKIRDGKEGCFTVDKTGSNTYQFSNGSAVTVN